MADENKEEMAQDPTEEMPEAAGEEAAAEAEPVDEPAAEVTEVVEETEAVAEPGDAPVEADELSEEGIEAQMLAEMGEEDAAALTAEASEEQAVFESEAVLPVQDGTAELTNIDMLMDVSMLITVELGRKEMRFNEILQLGKGSLVELNKVADEPVDIFINQSKVAEGEVVVVDDHFGVRVTRLLNTERLKRVG